MTDSPATKQPTSVGDDTAGDLHFITDSIAALMHRFRVDHQAEMAALNARMKPRLLAIQAECGRRGHYWNGPYWERRIFSSFQKRKCGSCGVEETLDRHFDRDDAPAVKP